MNPDATVETDAERVDALTVVANIKKGHATVTTGPVIELEVGEARPGDELVTEDDPVHVHFRVRAAPWVDVTHVDLVAGEIGKSYRIVESFDIPSRPTAIGTEVGTIEEAQERTIRFDRDFDVSLGAGNGWLQAVARGERRMDDVLPFMPLPPLGFTNPVYIVRHRVPPPPMPGVPVP